MSGLRWTGKLVNRVRNRRPRKEEPAVTILAPGPCELLQVFVDGKPVMDKATVTSGQQITVRPRPIQYVSDQYLRLTVLQRIDIVLIAQRFGFDDVEVVRADGTTRPLVLPSERD